jgi:hypothetical protein
MHGTKTDDVQPLESLQLNKNSTFWNEYTVYTRKNWQKSTEIVDFGALPV